MSDLPPPQPAIALPRLRHWLTCVFAWADRRKARRQARAWLIHADRTWRAEYETWWMEHGWREGADNPTTAYTKLEASRR